jgi:hypothetical protein
MTGWLVNALRTVLIEPAEIERSETTCRDWGNHKEKPQSE